MFDFTTETFSSLISIFSAVIGLGYPVLLQSIQRIDEQYCSVRLAYRFQQEISFKFFQFILFSNIIISILSPFVIYLLPVDFSNYVVSVQTVFILALLLCSFNLFNIIRIYYYPKDLITRLEKSSKELKPKDINLLQEDENNKYVNELMNIFDISVYGSQKENYDIYFSALSIVLHNFSDYHNSSDVEKPVVYPKGMMRILDEIRRQSVKSNEQKFFYKYNSITPFIYNESFKRKISEETYHYIWTTLNDVINSNNKGWFNQYWSYSDQYYRFVLSPIMREENSFINDTDKNRFFELHVMIGALLVYNKKYDWLKDIMYFTNQTPAHYDLIPGTFIAILNLAKEIDSMASFMHHRLLSSVYPFVGMKADVNTSYYIQNESTKYLSLLVIRLFIFDDYNINCCEPLELPSVPNNISDNKYNIGILRSIINGVDFWYDGKNIKKIHFNSTIPQKKEVIGLLNSYIKSCEEKIKDIIDNPKIDKRKISRIKDELYNYEEKYKKNVITDKSPYLNEIDKESYCLRNMSLPYSYKFERSEICEGVQNISVNLEEVLMQSLFNSLQRYYTSFFITIRSNADYTIQHSDILKALDCLELDSTQHIIFCQGVYLGNFENLYGKQENLAIYNDEIYYKNIPVIDIPSQERSLLILKKTDVPFYEFLKKVDEKDEHLALIKSESSLYSNIDNIDPINPILELKYYLRFYYKDEFKYIRIKISYNLPIGNVGDINKIQPF